MLIIIAGLVIGLTDMLASFEVFSICLACAVAVGGFYIASAYLPEHAFIYSKNVFPVYEWSATSGTVSERSGPAAAVLATCFLIAFWGAGAVVFLAPIYLGLAVMSTSVAVALIFAMDVRHGPADAFSRACAMFLRCAPPPPIPPPLTSAST